jgi:ABC-type nitrate/sulfonate/bicarbonate transport system substrate-binding protein
MVFPKPIQIPGRKPENSGAKMLLVLRAPSMSGLPFYVAEDLGFFDKEGVKIRCIHSHDPKRRVVQLLVEGEIAFYTSISAVVDAVTQGVKVKALCATSNSKYPCAASSPW